MKYILGHTKLGFCWWDLLALIILLILVIVWVKRRHDLKSEQKELEDQLFDLYADDSMGAQNTEPQEEVKAEAKADTTAEADAKDID